MYLLFLLMLDFKAACHFVWVIPNYFLVESRTKKIVSEVYSFERVCVVLIFVHVRTSKVLT